MEEILASIRRIIADDDGAKPKASEPSPPPAPKPAAPPPRAVVPPPAPPPPEPAKTQDEIDVMLAQLHAVHAPAPARPPAPAEEPAADILDLTESMATPSPAHSFRTIDAQSDVVFEESPPEPPASRFAEDARPPSREPDERALISSVTTAAVDSAFNSLAHTVLVQNARTLEDLVREMLRPMLKTWLDDNLPSLVERLVRAEIERVSRGRG
jgi:hypothetical protein